MPDELPPLVTTSKYVVVRDQYGTEKVIEIPTGAAIFVFDGVNAKWATGGADSLIPFGSVPALADGFVTNGVLLSDGAGNLARLGSGATDDVVRVLSIRNTVPKLDSLSALLGTGKGLLRKQADGTLDWLGGGGDPGVAEGIYWAKADGTVALITTATATPGQSLTLTPSGLAFASPSGITASSGAASSGLADVFAERPTTGTIHLTVPRLGLIDGSGSEMQANGVDLTFDGTSSGPGGVDIAGGLSADHFYFLYVIAKADGTLALLASLDNTDPDLTLSTDYTYYGLASIFYVKADGNIRGYIQRGKQFWQEETVWVDNWVTPAVYTSVPGTVGLGALVPTGFVKTVSGRIGGGASETAGRQYWIAATNTGIGAQYAGTAMQSFNGLKLYSGAFRNIPIANPNVPALYAKVTATSAAVKTKIIVDGFTI